MTTIAVKSGSTTVNSVEYEIIIQYTIVVVQNRAIEQLFRFNNAGRAGVTPKTFTGLEYYLILLI